MIVVEHRIAYGESLIQLSLVYAGGAGLQWCLFSASVELMRWLLLLATPACDHTQYAPPIIARYNNCHHEPPQKRLDGGEQSTQQPIAGRITEQPVEEGRHRILN